MTVSRKPIVALPGHSGFIYVRNILHLIDRQGSICLLNGRRSGSNGRLCCLDEETLDLTDVPLCPFSVDGSNCP